MINDNFELILISVLSPIDEKFLITFLNYYVMRSRSLKLAFLAFAFPIYSILEAYGTSVSRNKYLYYKSDRGKSLF